MGNDVTRLLESTVELMTGLARARGRAHLAELCLDDLTTFDREMHHLAGTPEAESRPDDSGRF